MTLHGKNFVGNQLSAEGSESITAVNPANGQELDGTFVIATQGEISKAAKLAAAASTSYRKLTAVQRAAFLEAIAEEILALGDPLLERANAETGLPLARLTGERGRTVGQLRMFATYIREGSWVQARIDPALPERKPLPRPDLRRMLIPIGPVAVFGASNFPFAFSVAGGDTASALAAGCPVVVKAHPAHPGVSELTASAILKAAEATGMPEGVFSLVHGVKETGEQLVSHPSIEAVAFTGSFTAGRALCKIAAARQRPIPVFAEMGSVNPVFLLPDAVAKRTEALAAGLAGSITLGVGQFCTNPGLLIAIESEELDNLKQSLGAAIEAIAPGTMLHAGISANYRRSLDALARSSGVSIEAQAATAENSRAGGSAALMVTTAEAFLANPDLAHEVFGPSSLLIECGSKGELEAVAAGLEGQLTSTIHGTEGDIEAYADLVTTVETKVGRLIFNGYPTGVEVSHTMQHGGPFPASSDSRTTSVGTTAIERFARPICYQDTPPALLPEPLQDANPLDIWRLVEGEMTKECV